MSVTYSQSSYYHSIPVRRKKLYILVLVDGSTSMTGVPMQQLNYGGREFEMEARELAADFPGVEVLVRVLRFDGEATWVTTEWSSAEDFSWVEVTVGDGGTNYADAFLKAEELLDVEYLGASGLRPQVLLVSDGMPTSPYQDALNRLVTKEPWGAASVRSAIGCGEPDMTVLEDFRGESGGLVRIASEISDLRSLFRDMLSTIIAFGSEAASGRPLEMGAVYEQTCQTNKE